MNGINNVMIMGRLGADPEMRTSKAGKAYCRFSVATNYTRKLESGEKESQTTWHKVKVFGKTAEHCQTYLRKGSTALVEGYLSKHTYKRDDGSEATQIDVVGRQVSFIDRPKNAPIFSAGSDEAKIPF